MSRVDAVNPNAYGQHMQTSNEVARLLNAARSGKTPAQRKISKLEAGRIEAAEEKDIAKSSDPFTRQLQYAQLNVDLSSFASGDNAKSALDKINTSGLMAVETAAKRIATNKASALNAYFALHGEKSSYPFNAFRKATVADTDAQNSYVLIDLNQAELKKMGVLLPEVQRRFEGLVRAHPSLQLPPGMKLEFSVDGVLQHMP